MDQFKLTIRFGNDAMQDAEDVAFALRALADKLMAQDFEGSSIVWDSNGNTVGEWSVA